MSSALALNNPNRSYARAAPVTPSDATVLNRTDALLVSVSGTLVCTFDDGTSATITVPAGLVKLAVVKVGAASTATGISALYLS